MLSRRGPLLSTTATTVIASSVLLVFVLLSHSHSIPATGAAAALANWRVLVCPPCQQRPVCACSSGRLSCTSGSYSSRGTTPAAATKVAAQSANTQTDWRQQSIEARDSRTKRCRHARREASQGEASSTRPRERVVSAPGGCVSLQIDWCFCAQGPRKCVLLPLTATVAVCWVYVCVRACVRV